MKPLERNKLLKVFQKILPMKDLKAGMYVRCMDGRFKGGYLLGKIFDIETIYYVPYRRVGIETLYHWIYKRDSTIVCEVTEEEYLEWMKKREKNVGQKISNLEESLGEV